VFPRSEFARGNGMSEPGRMARPGFSLPVKEESSAAVPSPFLADTFTVF